MDLGRRNRLRRRALAGLLLAWGAIGAAPGRAAPAEEAIDDPKLARRLGTRIFWETPPAPPPGSTVETSPPPIAGVTSAAGGGRASETPPAAAVASREVGFEPVLPRVQLGFRRFDFVRIGASASAGLAAPEAFDCLSIDVYPVSSLIRVGLSTAYGWQEGMSSGGDYLATETASLGAQLAFGHVVPFAEALAGVGYMRRIQFDRSIPTVYWQLGIDAGASLYLARVGFVSLAIGYLRPANGFAKEQSFESVYSNTWSFKLGIGI